MQTKSTSDDAASGGKDNIPKTATPMLWHYAPWAYLHSIVAAEKLLCSNAGAEDERPLLWFSTNQQWEPTATKLFIPDFPQRRRAHQMTFAQQAERFGCIRFGILSSDARILSWKDACDFAGTNRAKRRAMELAGKKMGGHPTNWYAVGRPVDISETVFQVWLQGWRHARPHEMVQVWTEHKASTM